MRFALRKSRFHRESSTKSGQGRDKIQSSLYSLSDTISESERLIYGNLLYIIFWNYQVNMVY